MSKIEELIAQYCPDGVEWKELGEITSIKGRIGFRGYTKADIVAKGKGAISLSPSNIINQEIEYSNSTYISWDKYEESPEIKIFENDVVFCKTASVGKTALVKNLPQEATLNPQLIVFKQIACNNAYFAYCLKTDSFKLKVQAVTGLGSVPNVSQSALSKITIPIPPLPVQEEIVRILDKFTALEAELEAELEARTRQYEYYRDQLLSFEGKGVEWKSLGEIAFYGKKRIPFERVNEDNYVGVENLLQNKKGVAKSNYIPKKGNLIEFINDDILIGNIRPYLKKIWKSEISGGTNGDVLVIRISEDFVSKIKASLLYYLLSSDEFFKYNMQFAKGAKMPRGDKDAILKYQIPIPPLEEQERIVTILDKFDALVNDISQGLPAEIQARRKQYEYYRERLLTFDELAVS